MPRSKKTPWEKAQTVWAKHPNRMIIFAPNTHEKIEHDYQKDRWLLADQWAILAIGHSHDDMAMARDTLKRK